MLYYFNISSRREKGILIKEKKVLINTIIAGLVKKAITDKWAININIRFLEYGTLEMIFKELSKAQLRVVENISGFKILNFIRVNFREISLRTPKGIDLKLFYKSFYEELRR